jgi:hypothetical protein
MAVYGMPKGKNHRMHIEKSHSSKVLKMVVLYRQSLLRAKGKLKEEAWTFRG